MNRRSLIKSALGALAVASVAPLALRKPLRVTLPKHVRHAVMWHPEGGSCPYPADGARVWTTRGWLPFDMSQPVDSVAYSFISFHADCPDGEDLDGYMPIDLTGGVIS